jgi:hypothetical protein
MTNSYEYRKRKGLNKGAHEDLKLGKPGKMEKYQPKERPVIISDAEQAEVDRGGQNSETGAGYRLDTGRSLSQAECDAYVKTITPPVEGAHFNRHFKLHVNGS